MWNASIANASWSGFHEIYFGTWGVNAEAKTSISAVTE